MLEIGCGKADVTAYHPEIGMLGYGRFDQFAQGVEVPLSARAVAIFDPDSGRRIVMVVADLCFVTQAVRQAVIGRLASDHAHLAIGERELLVTANHTHSGPGGFTHHLFYNVNIPGFAEPVFRDIVAGITSAIVKAAEARVPGHVRRARGSFAPDEPIAFNRSMPSFLRNPEAAGYRLRDRHRAVDREMTLLRFESADGRPLGAWCWFGVHGTSVRGENRKLHPDNKGLAALAVEAHAARTWGVDGFVAAFAQGPCGDVTPNLVTHPRKRAADADNGLEEARIHGDRQARQAIALFEEASKQPDIGSRLGAAIRYADQADQNVNPRFVRGRKGLRTIPATVGIIMPTGTEEGPGALRPLLPFFRVLNRAEGAYRTAKSVFRRNPPPWRDPRGPRFVFIETGRGDQGRAFQLFNIGRPILPSATDRSIAFLRKVSRQGGMGSFTWTPTVLPAQILLLGHIAIVGLPCEITTIAGRRLASTVLKSLSSEGVDQVLVTPFANAYASYVTTPEEYLVQRYEGACTLYGRWTLPAWQTRFAALADTMRTAPWDPGADLGLKPPLATPAMLAAQRWEGPRI